MNKYFSESFGKDFLSSIVVFLVALPLCMGIALASGVEPIVGLLSGIVGGLVVGVFAGCPLQVSGPAAGLAVMVFQFIEKYGVEALVPLGIIVGVFQVMMYRLKLAQYFRAISPALIKGMLSGIGLLILVSQIHIAMVNKPGGNGLKNILSIPELFMNNIVNGTAGRVSFAVALLTVVSIFVWQKFLPKINKKFPAPLFAILLVSTVANIMGLNISFVDIPDNLLKEINFISTASFANFSFGMIFSGIAIAFVASAESLLCVNAVDKLTKTKSDYDKEIFAQGLGNVVAGFLGALPLTGVIVRSSANIESGGETRGAAIMHGVWLLALVFLLPQVLELVPIAALAGILIFTGIKLLALRENIALIKQDKKEGLVFLLTIGLITSIDLLTGVVIGFIASVIMLVTDIARLDVEGEAMEGNKKKVNFSGKATFLHIPKIAKQLDSVKLDEASEVIIDLSKVQYLDKTIKAEIEEWANDNQSQVGELKVLYPESLKKTN